MTTRLFYTLIIAACQLFFLWIIAIGLQPFYYPIIIAIVLSYLSQPAIEFLQRRIQLSRPLALAVIFSVQMVAIGLFLLAAIPFLLTEIIHFISQLPQLIQYLVQKIQSNIHHYNLGAFIDIDALQEELITKIRSFSKISPQTLYHTLTIAKGTASQLLSPVYWLTTIVIVPVMYFFLGLYADRILPWIENCSPKSYRSWLVATLTLANELFSAYFRGQIIVVSFLCCLYSLGLSLIGIPYGLMIGITTGILSFVPYLGLISGFVLALVSLFYTQASILSFLGLLLVFVVINSFESLFLTPTFMGNRVGLSNLTSILSLIIAGHLFGFIGLVFAIPMTALGSALFQQLVEQHKSLDDKPIEQPSSTS